jgi:hypothetical protein
VTRFAALLAVALTGAFLTAAAPPAAALPGQCMYTPWGGFCDSAPWQDGSFQHCKSALGFSQCYQACHDPVANQAVPTDLDPRTPC